MDNPAIRHLKELYGLNPDILPFALQFPRIPPGTLHPMIGLHNSPKKQLQRKADVLGPNLGDFKEMYQKLASGLIDFNQSALIPPGHPLYSKNNSIETLKAENEKLKKENFELKKNLDKTSQNISDDHNI